MTATVTPVIEPLQARDFSRCAQLMAQSDPWVTLGVTREDAVMTLMRSTETGIVARKSRGGELLGFIRYEARGFVGRFGYVRTVGVAAEARGQGIGEALMDHVETDCFSLSPHVFLFCSSFNAGAQRFYERLGYVRVGEVAGLLLPQHGEVLYVKTRRETAT